MTAPEQLPAHERRRLIDRREGAPVRLIIRRNTLTNILTFCGLLLAVGAALLHLEHRLTRLETLITIHMQQTYTHTPQQGTRNGLPAYQTPLDPTQ